MVCFDAKINFDDNAEFRQKTVFAMDDMSESDPLETEAAKWDLKYIGLDGNIACFGTKTNSKWLFVLFLFLGFSPQRERSAALLEVKVYDARIREADAWEQQLKLIGGLPKSLTNKGVKKS